MLDNTDKLILAELDKNARASISEISKNTKLRRSTVQYRFDKLQKKVITRFFADIDVAKTGFILNKIAFQLQDESIYEFLKQHKNVGWAVMCSGRWDALIVAYVQDMQEYQALVDDITKQYGDKIQSKAFVAHPKYYVCSRKWLNNTQPSISEIGGKPQPDLIDETDKQIILMLTKNAREPILAIAQATKLSSSTVIQRIKKLEKEKIILNYRIGLNLQVIGKEFCKAFIYFEHTNETRKQEFIKHCLHHENVTAATYAIGPWDFELEMEVDDFEAFYDVMKELKARFADIVRNYESVFITKEYGIDYSSFLK